MSELINNQQQRQAKLKELIQKLHDGIPMDVVQQEFTEHFANVSASEISAIEQALVMEGLPVTEIQRLCDVHAAVFKGSIEDIHKPVQDESWPGHPVSFLKKENAALEKLIDQTIEPASKAFLATPDPSTQESLLSGIKQLWQIDRHYSKKENLLFSFLEKHDVTAPPKVMWGVDDEIRGLIKTALSSVDQWPANGLAAETISHQVDEALGKTREMVFKEEHILLPMSLEKLTVDEWRQIAADSFEIGFCLIDPPPAWPEDSASEKQESEAAQSEEPLKSGSIRLPTGVFRLDELTAMLNALPFDITFVDSDDTVRYFSQGSDRIFDRNRSIIGRKVANCHPPASVHIVEQIVNDFKSGARDQADFWIRMGPRYVLIRYYAVRGEEGQYLGTLEVTQDIAPIQEITGEKRLLDG